MDMASSLALTALLITASAFDLFRFRIPNVIPLALVVLFVVKLPSATGPLPWHDHLAIAMLVLVLGFVAFAAGVIGGGDAKLMAALALWFGPLPLPAFLAVTGIGGGLFALAMLAARWMFGRQPSAEGGASRLSDQWPVLRANAPIPYALPISAAALWLEWG